MQSGNPCRQVVVLLRLIAASLPLPLIGASGWCGCRSSGGVGGEEPRGSPLSRSLGRERTPEPTPITERWFLFVCVRFVASSRPVMRYAKEASDITRCSAIGRLPRRASPATARSEARGTTSPRSKGSAVGARADTATASITAVGGQPSGSGQPR